MKDGKLSVRSSKADLGMQSLQVVYGQKEVCSCRHDCMRILIFDVSDLQSVSNLWINMSVRTGQWHTRRKSRAALTQSRIIKLPIMLPISFLSARYPSNNMNLSSESIQPYGPLLGVVFVIAQNEACYQQPEYEESGLNSPRPRLAQLEALNIIALRAQHPEPR